MLSKLQRNQKGFTLIELMIVVVIIGILAALAVPRFMRATTKSKQSEAKTVLKQIYVLERAYFQENDTYVAAANTAALAAALSGFEVPSGSPRYTYSVAAGAGGITTSFTATATGNIDDDATNDVWTIDQNGTLTNTTNDVTN